MFAYDALDNAARQIRLIRILPAKRDDRLELELTEWDVERVRLSRRIKNAPPYIAISYAWGCEDTQQLTVDGSLLPVRVNCYYALWQARLHYADQYLWIDSICINQADSSEKSAQVSMMWPIYSTARKVLACVGPAEEQSDAFIATACLLRSVWDVHRPFCEYETLRAHADLQVFYLQHQAFRQRPYWKRLWIVQELAAARSRHEDSLELLCGEHVLPWKTLIVVETILCVTCEPTAQAEGWTHYNARDLRNSNMHRIVLHASDVRSRVDIAMPYFMTFECGDRRDRLYGILSMISWYNYNLEPLFPDYNITTFELASRVCERVPFHAAFDVVGCFRISHRDQEVQRLIGQRQHAPGAADKISWSPSNKRATKPHKFHCMAMGIDSSMLFSSATLLSRWKAEMQLHIDPAICRELCALFDTMGPFLNNSNKPPHIMVRGGRVAALLPHGTQAADVLVKRAAYGPPAVLILRQNDDLEYDVVGQALEMKSEPNGSQVFGDGSWSSDLHEFPEAEHVDVELLLTPEDIVLLCAQHKDADGITECGEYLRRLDTRPLEHPRSAAKMQPAPIDETMLRFTDDSELWR